MKKCIFPVAIVALVLLVVCVAGKESGAEELRNQLQNSSFEQDWFVASVLAERRWNLIARAEVGYNESDGKVDHWEIPVSSWDNTVAHSGKYSVKLGGTSVIKKVTQGVRYAMRAPAGGNPASQMTNLSPIDPADAKKIEPRLVRGGIWVKAENAGGAYMEICGTKIPVPDGTYEWKYLEGRTQEKIGPRDALIFNVVCNSGTIWIDDAVLAEEPEPNRNRAGNGSFEELDPDNYPKGFSKTEHYWKHRLDYYSWTGWGHDGGYGSDMAYQVNLIPGYKPKGNAEPDLLISHSGKSSMRTTAYPGDAYCVMGSVIKLNQPEPEPVEIGCWIKADNVLNVDISLYDSEKNEFVTMDSDNLMYLEATGVSAGAKGQGTYDWTYFRRLVCPKYALKEVKPVIAVRGFDGRIVEKNIVGTAWFDDLEVFERKPSFKTTSVENVVNLPVQEPKDIRITDIDFGDRLWGDNEVVAGLRNASPKQEKGTMNLEIISPDGEKQSAKKEFVLAAGEKQKITLGYRIEKGCDNWDKQYKLKLDVTVGDKTRTITTGFGAPGSLLFTRTSHTYAFPEEKPVIAVNVRVSNKSLNEVGKMLLQIIGPDGKNEIEKLIDSPGTNLPVIVPEANQIRHLNHDRLITIAPDVSKLKIRKWNEATRDYTVVVKLYDKNGKEMVTAEGGKFGRMERFPASDIDVSAKVEVNDEHFIIVGGKPVFPVYFGEYGDTFRPEEGINITRDQIRSLGVNIGTGEWDLNGLFDIPLEKITAMADSAKAKNPGRLLVSQYDLVSHYGSCNPRVANLLFPAFDVLCIEASFASHVPNLRNDYFPAMKGKNCAIMVGFENYYFVSYDVLRYRSYLSVMRGASGLGLIPSRMMAGMPESNNYLRGLNAECRALASVFASPSPKTLTKCSDPIIFTWEKYYNGKRYLFAVRGEPFITRGIWEWTKNPSGRDGRVHTEPADSLMTQHLYQNGKPVLIPKDAKIKQEIYVEGVKPKMIGMQFRTKTNLDNTWEHRAYWGVAEPDRYRKEAEYPMDSKPPKAWRSWMVVENPGQPINFAADRGAFYFEVLGGLACKAVDGTASLRKMGEVPEAGKWVSLEIPCDKIGLTDKSLDGICFTVDGGRVLWGRTMLSVPGREDEVLIDGSLEKVAVDEGEKEVTFEVPDAKTVKVKTLYENRKIETQGKSFRDIFEKPYSARLYEIEVR